MINKKKLGTYHKVSSSTTRKKKSTTSKTQTVKIDKKPANLFEYVEQKGAMDVLKAIYPLKRSSEITITYNLINDVMNILPSNFAKLSQDEITYVWDILFYSMHTIADPNILTAYAIKINNPEHYQNVVENNKSLSRLDRLVTKENVEKILYFYNHFFATLTGNPTPFYGIQPITYSSSDLETVDVQTMSHLIKNIKDVKDLLRTLLPTARGKLPPDKFERIKASRYEELLSILDRMEKQFKFDISISKKKPIKIKNIKAAGTHASGFAYTVLQARFDGDTVTFDYATPEWEDYRPGKMNYCTMQFVGGAIASGYKNHDPELLGEAEKWIEKAKVVRGKTYVIKDLIKQYGFKWDPVNKQWVKKGD